MKENPFHLYNVIQLRCLISNSKIQKESKISFLSFQYIMLCVKSRLFHYLLAWHSNLSLFLPILMELWNFVNQLHKFLSAFSFPLSQFSFFFPSLGTTHVGRIFLSLFQLHLVELFYFLALFFFSLLNMYALWYIFYQSHTSCCYSLFLIICLYVIKCTMCSWQNICNY